MKIIDRFKKTTALVVVGLLMFGLVPSNSYAADEVHVFTKIVTGTSHTFGIKADGTVWAWGVNTKGQLGDGTRVFKTTPIQVQDLTDVVSVSVGSNQTLALKKDGTVWGWGLNNYGQLGDGTNVDRLTPVQVQGLTEVREIEAGSLHSLALKSDGTVWSWGWNTSGQLGDGTNINKSTPVQVQGLADVTKIEAGGAYSLALKSDGTVWAWGNNNTAQIGAGTVGVHQLIPIQVMNLTNVMRVDAGSLYSLALKSDGTVWAWGDNEYGQLGDGTNIDKLTPVQVQGLTNVRDLTASQLHHAIAIKPDGTVWTWGYNYLGQLGDGTNVHKSIPIQIKDLTDMVSVDAGSFYAIAIKSDGTAWAWGDNRGGQFGNGTTTSEMYPILSPYIKLAPIEEEPESDIEKATEAVLKAETTKLQSDIDDARILVNELTDETAKQNLSARLDVLQAEIDSENENARKLAEATNAVTNAETTKLQADLDSARALVNALEASSEKTALNERLNTLQIYILQLKLQELIDKIEELINSGNLTGTDMKEIEDAWGEIEDVVNQIPDSVEKEEITEQLKVKEAETAVIKAELSKLQTDVDSARVLVNALPEGADKTALTERLNAVQTQIDESLEGEDETEEPVPTNTPSAITAAEKKLKIAETYKRDPYIANTEEAINALIDSPEKTAMLERIESLKTSVEDEQLQKLIKTAESKVAIAEKYKKESYINSAREVLEQLPDGAEKETFEARLDALEEEAPTEGAPSSARAVKVAVRATERAERTPTRYSIVYADKKTSALTDATPEKVGLVERVAVLKAQYQGTITEQNAEKAITNAVRYVELAEKYKNNYYFTKAEGLVSSLTNGDSKTTLSSRLEALRPVVYPSAEQTLIDEAVKAVESAEKYPSNTAYVSRAVKAVGFLPEGQIKTNLLERIETLTTKAA